MAPSIPTATLLTLSLPSSPSSPLLLGIDLISLTPPATFHGFKSLPPGLHFVYTGTSISLSLRHGTWFYIPPSTPSSPPPFLLSKWDTNRECLMPVRDQEENMRWRANLGQIWDSSGRLMPYRQSLPGSKGGGKGSRGVDARWGVLTSHITPGLLNRVLGENEWSITTASSARRDADDLDIPGLTQRDVTEAVFGGEEGEKELTFLSVDLRKTWREGAVGRERTDAAKDRSWALGDLVERFCGGEEGELLGELQVTFLMVVCVGSWSSMEQWKRLLGLMLTCGSALEERKEFFTGAIRVLRCQLRVAKEAVDDGGLFGEDMGFLQVLLRGFGKRLEEAEPGTVQGVKKELETLDDETKELYGWDLKGEVLKRGMLELEDGEMVEMEMNDAAEEDETGEYAPVVVDLEGLNNTSGEERSIPMR